MNQAMLLLSAMLLACQTAPPAPEAPHDTPVEAPAPSEAELAAIAADEAKAAERAADEAEEAARKMARAQRVHEILNPHPFAWKAWGVHAVTGERFDVLRERIAPDPDQFVPLRGPLTIELTLLEGPPPKTVRLFANSKETTYRRRGKTFTAKALKVGVPVTWKVEVGTLMELELQCPQGGCKQTTYFPIWVKRSR